MKPVSTGDFYKLIFGNLEGYLCVVTIDRGKGKATQQYFFPYPDKLSSAVALGDRHKSQLDVYFSPFLYTRQRRKKSDVIETPVAWADGDECPIESLILKPTAIIRTSEGRHAFFWKFDEPQSAVIGEEISKRIAYFHAGEGMDKSGWDLTQLLRVPDTYNHKYTPPQQVGKAHVDYEAIYEVGAFDEYPTLNNFHITSLSEANIPEATAEELLERYKNKVHPQVHELFRTEPQGNSWSESLWKLERMLLEASLPAEEVYVVAEAAACNKYKRDGRDPNNLWREVLRAANLQSKENLPPLEEVPYAAEPPELLTAAERQDVLKDTTIVEEYTKWASELGDAAEQYHPAGALVVLSTLLSGAISLPTSFGPVVPNLWFLVLADSTITRKAQPLDAKILTPDGWKRMEDVRVGDYVVGSDGKPTEVVGVYPQGIQPTYRVTFNDGARTECSLDHLWVVHGRGGKNPKLRPLSWIRRKLEQDRTWLRQIPSVNPVHFAEKTLPIDPYLMGILLGDGSFSSRRNSISFTTADDEIVQSVQLILSRYSLGLNRIKGTDHDYSIARTSASLGYKGVSYKKKSKKWRAYKYINGKQKHLGTFNTEQEAVAAVGSTSQTTRYKGRNHVYDTVESLGLVGKKSWEKFIPSIYLHGSIQQRLDLLQGLMDSDGHTNNNSTSFTSTSKELALGVQYLVRSLGGWSSINDGRNTTYGHRGETRVGRRSYTVSVSMPMGMSPFRLGRKASRLSDRAWSRPRSIRAIDYIGDKPQQCIKVDNPNGLYVTDDFIVTHNTTAMTYATDILDDIDPDALLATDGSMEGLLTALAGRPGKPSLFLRDEFTGLMEALAKKDYMAGMMETLTKLYDGKRLKRVLRKEIIDVRDPVVVIFGGGIRTKMIELMDFKHVYTGFLPRFIIVTAESDLDKLQPVGPPSEENLAQRANLLRRFTDLYEHYAVGKTSSDGRTVRLPKHWDAELDSDAWLRYNSYEVKMMNFAMRAPDPSMATPMMDRLAKSGLKVAVLLAASRHHEDKVLVTEQDILHAFYYVEQWAHHAAYIIGQVGMPQDEKKLMRILSYIETHPGVTRARIMQRHWLSARETTVAFTTLEERGLISRERTGRSERLWPKEDV